MTTSKAAYLTPPDDVLLATIGAGLARKRVRLGLSQQELAHRAGVGKRTLERLEAGQPTQLASFLRILRELDLLPILDVLSAESGPSPMQLLRTREAEPKRAGWGHKKPDGPAKPWTWGDQT